MTTRTSISKAELARLQAVDAMYAETITKLKQLANDDSAVVNFTNHTHSMGITINRSNNTVTNWA